MLNDMQTRSNAVSNDKKRNWRID